MGVLKRWNGTEWEIIGAPTKSTGSKFVVENDGILAIVQEVSEDSNESEQE